MITITYNHQLKLATTFLFLILSSSKIKAQEEYRDGTFGDNGMVVHNSISGQGVFGKLLNYEDGLFAFLYFPGSGGIANSPKIFKYNINGNLDTTFNSTGIVTTDLQYSLWTWRDPFQGFLGLTSDNKLLAVTSAQVSSETFAPNFIGKFNLDGSVDTTFGNSGYVGSIFTYSLNVFEVKLLNNDDLLIIGQENIPFAEDDLNANIVIAKFNSQGELITDFGVNGIIKFPYNSNEIGLVQTQLSKNNDALFAAWYTEDINGNPADGVISKYDLATESIDTSFGDDGNLTINNQDHAERIHRFLSTQNGELYIAIHGIEITNFVSYFGAHLIKYDNQQSLDLEFGENGYTEISDDPSMYTKNIFLINNKFYINGEYDGDKSFFLKRLDINGAYDSTFGNSGTILETSTTKRWTFDLFTDENTITTSGASPYQSSYVKPSIFRYLINPNLGVKESNITNLKIYPNPTNSALFISSDSKIENIIIFNSLGELIKKEQVTNNKLDISSLPSGIYLLQLIDRNQNQSFTQIIKN